MGPQALAVSEVAALLTMLGIQDGATRMKYLRLIQRLDEVERRFIQSQRQAKS